jgi:hypothetical protein
MRPIDGIILTLVLFELVAIGLLTWRLFGRSQVTVAPPAKLPLATSSNGSSPAPAYGFEGYLAGA